LLSTNANCASRYGSGRFELAHEADGTYFIDRDGSHFRLVLNFLRDLGSVKLGSAVMAQREMQELAAEARFYGLLNRMMHFLVQERIGQELLKRACLTRKARDILTAMAQVRVLAFDMESTTPFLTDEFQAVRWVITDRVVNGSPVWAAAAAGSGGGNLGMYLHRNIIGNMMVSKDARCGNDMGFLQNMYFDDDAMAPTEQPPDKWASHRNATLASQFASATPTPSSSPPAPKKWVWVPAMRITAVHGLADDEPAMAAALQQLAALA
jgi:hypothetical protein